LGFKSLKLWILDLFHWPLAVLFVPTVTSLPWDETSSLLCNPPFTRSRSRSKSKAEFEFRLGSADGVRDHLF